jgi:hypothetical protein
VLSFNEYPYLISVRICVSFLKRKDSDSNLMAFSESLGINVRAESGYIYHASVTDRVLVSKQNLITFYCVSVEYFVLVSEQNM